MIFFSKFVQTLNKQLEDGASPRAVVYAGLLRFSKTVFANFHFVPINGEFMIYFFSKFVQTLNKQLENGASPRAVDFTGLLRINIFLGPSWTLRALWVSRASVAFWAF